MCGRVALALAMVPCLVWSSTQADDAAEALAISRMLCESTRNKLEVALDRHHATWEVVGVNVWAESDCDLSQFAALTTLESLTINISSWQVARTGIDKLGALRRLRKLSLPWQLTDAELAAICTLPMLEDLSVRYSDVKVGDWGLLHLRDIHGLQRLALDGFGFSDKSLHYVEFLTGLEKLCLMYEPDITDVGLGKLQGLTNLRELDLRGDDRITDSGITRLKDLPNLRFLAIDKLGETGMSALKDAPQLEHLDIGEYDPGDGMADLSVLHGLRWLTIHSVAGNKTRSVRLPENLRRLEASNYTVGKLDLQSSKNIERIETRLGRGVGRMKDVIDLTWLSSLPHLRDLTVEFATDQDMKAIAGISSLRTLTATVGGCSGSIDEGGVLALAQLSQLESLDLAAVGSDAAVDLICRLANLRQLELHGFANASTKALARISELRQLRTLRLSLQDNMDGVLAHTATLAELEELSLHGTVSNDGLKNLASLKKLRRLDLGATDGYSDDALASLMRALPNLQEVKRTYRPLPDQAKQ